MKASRAAVRTAKAVGSMDQKLDEILWALERIEAKVDAVMFPDPIEEEEPEAEEQ